MNKDFDSSEAIEAYLRNELSPTERVRFEERITQDPLLQNELTLQSEIIASLQAHRKAELKQRLDRIDVSDSSDSNHYLRLMGLFAAFTALLSLGIFTYLNYTESNEANTPTTAQPQMPPAPEETQPTVTTPPTGEEATATTTEVPKTPPAPAVAPTVKGRPATAKRTTPKPAVRPSEPTGSKAIRPESEKSRLQPESSNANANGHRSREEKEEALANGKVTMDAGKRPNGLNITYDDTQYSFHYRNYKDNLELFGDFSKGYRKVKWHDHLYIYFENNFYAIRANQEAITPLVKVSDEALVQQLRNLVKAE